MGVDFGVLADRIYGAFDYYVSNTEDLLLNVNVPSSTGFATVLTNVGEVRNTGFEAQITSRNLVGAFQWSTDLSLGMNSNEVVKLGPEGDPILAAGVAGVRHITQVGGEIGAYYGYVHNGIYQSEADIASSPVDERNVTPGDIKWQDVNGDGRITADDRTELGSYNPDMTWGLFNRFAFGNLELSVFFQGVVGREVLNLTRRHLTAQGNFNAYGNLVGNYWRSPERAGQRLGPQARPAGPRRQHEAVQLPDGGRLVHELQEHLALVERAAGSGGRDLRAGAGQRKGLRRREQRVHVDGLLGLEPRSERPVHRADAGAGLRGVSADAGVPVRRRDRILRGVRK